MNRGADDLGVPRSCRYGAMMGQHQQGPVTETELAELERLVSRASPGPWIASVEGRDHTSGDSMIMIGDPREEDMYVNRDTGPASAADLDFIVAARNLVSRLIEEVRRAREVN